MSKLKLMGKLCRDKVTGFTGICVSKHTFITGCDQYALQPEYLKETNVIPESRAFDVGRIEVLGDGISIKEITDTEKPGGPEMIMSRSTK